MSLWRVWLRSNEGRRARYQWRKERRLQIRDSALCAFELEGIAMELPTLVDVGWERLGK